MATKNEVEKKGFMGFMAKVGKFFKSMPGRIARRFREMVGELKKVTWPSRKDLIRQSTVVIVFVLILTVVVGLMDYVLSNLLRLIIS